MVGKRYSWIWWLVGILVVIGIIWYTVRQGRQEDYTDGTFVWNSEAEFCRQDKEDIDVRDDLS